MFLGSMLYVQQTYANKRKEVSSLDYLRLPTHLQIYFKLVSLQAKESARVKAIEDSFPTPEMHQRKDYKAINYSPSSS